MPDRVVPSTQLSKKKGFAWNDKILHGDGDFFAIPPLAQLPVVV
jgi:hypothetical protein